MLQYSVKENLAKFHRKRLNCEGKRKVQEIAEELRGFERNKEERGKRFEEKVRDKFLFGENN